MINVFFYLYFTGDTESLYNLEKEFTSKYYKSLF